MILTNENIGDLKLILSARSLIQIANEMGKNRAVANMSSNYIKSQ